MTEDTVQKALMVRLLLRRGGKKIYETYTEAVGLGVDRSWFTDSLCSVFWRATEKTFADTDPNGVTLLKIVQEAKSVAYASSNEAERNLELNPNVWDEVDAVVNPIEDMAAYVSLLREDVMRRGVGYVIERAVEGLKTGGKVVDVASEMITECQDVLRDKVLSGSVVDVANCVEAKLDEWFDIHHHKNELGERDYCRGLPLPWRDVHEGCGGIGKVVTVVAARPGVGKTSFALALMRFWTDRGIKVYFDSLDMEASEFTERQIAEEAQTSTNAFGLGKIECKYWDYQFSKIKVGAERVKAKAQAGLVILDEELNVDKLYAKVKVLKDQGKIDVLMVDYIQKMRTSGENRFGATERISAVSNRLREIVNTLKVPVIALAQINREADKDGSEPRLHNIKGSGEIEQDAANVIILHPAEDVKKIWGGPSFPSQFARNMPTARPESIAHLTPMWVILAKTRKASPNKHVPFVVDQSCFTWYQGDIDGGTNEEKFARVHDLWKHDEIENIWERNGALIRDEVVSQIEAFNGGLER